jgi:hypothetical protein
VFGIISMPKSSAKIKHKLSMDQENESNSKNVQILSIMQTAEYNIFFVKKT